MIYISEIKLTELVNNFCEEIERQKKLAENFSKQCTELELKLSHFMTDEELSFMNANPKLRLELTEENQQLKKKSSVIYETSILTGTWNISAKPLWNFE